MAIYSCNLKSIGRTTHAAGTAGAHVRYIARDRAEPEILAQHMPEDPNAARAFLDAGERNDRKNARVVDKIRVALPRELSAEQRAQLVRDFMADLTRNKVPWYAAIHQTGKDAHNPHAHIIVRDRDLLTDRRVLRLADNFRDRAKDNLPGPKGIEWVRERWEAQMNRALERAGHAVRVDRRTLKAQGIDRVPTIHIGPNAQQIDKFVERPQSQVRRKGKRSNQKDEHWVSDYPMIDAGRTRKERNSEIIDLNLARAAKSKDFETRQWAKFEKEQRFLDRNLENQLIPEARRRTLEERQMCQGFRAKLTNVKQQKQADLKINRDWMRAKYAPAFAGLKDTQAKELADTHKRQKNFFVRLWSGLDITGTFRRKQEQTKTNLLKGHRAARKAFRQKYRSEAAKRLEAIQKRSAPQYDAIKKQRRDALFKLRESHKDAETSHDRLWQARETERAQGAEVLEKTIADWKRMQKKRVNEKDRDHGRERSRERGRGPR
jgi:MobA/MobL family protein